jgi:hypothetical protein
MRSDFPTAEQVVRASTEYDRAFGHVDAEFWAWSQHVRESLLAHDPSKDVLDFVWAIKCKWGIQGVRKETGPIAATVLAAMDWEPGWFDLDPAYTEEDERFALSSVAGYVSEMQSQGVARREFSYASKVLHWVMPARIPLYDSAVRGFLGVPQGWAPRTALKAIIGWEFAAARELLAGGRAWLGDSQPATPLRALDKYLWWEGAGKESQHFLRSG